MNTQTPSSSPIEETAKDTSVPTQTPNKYKVSWLPAVALTGTLLLGGIIGAAVTHGDHPVRQGQGITADRTVNPQGTGNKQGTGVRQDGGSKTSGQNRPNSPQMQNQQQQPNVTP